MMTVGEQTAVREIKQASIRFEKSVERLIRLEAIKAESEEKRAEILKLLEDL